MCKSRNERSASDNETAAILWPSFYAVSTFGVYGVGLTSLAKSDYKPYSAEGANAEETTGFIFALTLLITKQKTPSKLGKTCPDKVQ